MIKVTFRTSDSHFTRIVPSVDQENIQESASQPNLKKGKRKRKSDTDQEFLPNKKKKGEAAVLEENRKIFADKQKELLEYVEKAYSKKASKDQQSLRESSQHNENRMTSSMEISCTEKESFGCSVGDPEDKNLGGQAEKSVVHQICPDTTESKPKVLRKFKPPMSRYRLKELAAEKAAAEALALEALKASEDRPSTPLSVAASVATEIQHDSGIEDSPVKAEPSIEFEASEKPMISIPTEELDDLQIDMELTMLLADLVNEDQKEKKNDSPRLKKPCKPSNTAGINEINAWLAQKQSRWCVKDKTVLEKMLERESLVSTYKCMVSNCSFTTISTRNFTRHMDCHEAVDPEIRFLFHCPYCLFKGSSSAKLLDHYKICHRFDKFQCGYCFYRSASAGSCQEHIKSFHKHSEIKIYECLLEAREIDPKYMERLDSKRQMFVIPLSCSACKTDFFCCELYQKHIDGHLEDDKTRKIALDDSQIFGNKIENNSVGLFECLFCEFASGSSRELNCHMQDHPREAMMWGKRKSPLMSNNPHSIQSVQIIKFKPRSPISIVPFDLDKKVLINSNRVTCV